MENKSWNAPKSVAAALFLVIVIMGITFAVLTLRNRSGSVPAGSGTGAEAADGRKDSYAKALATRKELIQQLLAALRTASEKPDREATARVSADLVREGRESVAPILASLKENRAWNFRMALVAVLGKIRDAEAIRALEDFYLTLGKEDLAAKLEVVRTLERSGAGAARDILQRLFVREADAKVKAEIGRALVAAGIRPEELDSMPKPDRALLEKEVLEKQAQRSRIERLDKLEPKSDADLPELKKAALEETTVGIALIAFRKLEERGDSVAADLLAQRVRVKAESSDERLLQTNALSSLSRMKAAAARTLVRDIVLSDNPPLRRQAIVVLGSFGDEAMLPVLEQAGRADPETETRRLIDQAILAIRSRASRKTPSAKEGS